MPELRLTVVMPQDPENEPEALDALMASLAAESGRFAQFVRAPGFGKPDGPLRVFNVKFSGEEALAAVLRGTGAWYMRHPKATVTLRMESSKGGVTLQLKEYSPVAFAASVTQIQNYLE